MSQQPPSLNPASCTSDTCWETRPCPEAKMGTRFHTHKSAAETSSPSARQNWSAGTRKCCLDKFVWKGPWCYLHRFPAYFAFESKPHTKKKHMQACCSEEATITTPTTEILLPAWIINTFFLFSTSIKTVDRGYIPGQMICPLSPYHPFQTGYNKLFGARSNSPI